MTPSPTSRRSDGFSLMELLLVIALIGILSNIALFALSGTSSKVDIVKNKRNAQTIASLAAAASAAGASFVVSGDVRATVTNLQNGTAPTSGAFKGRVFKLQPMTDDQIDGALPYLSAPDTELLYKR
ncbi:MAG: hypothetical protein CJBNEKGG_04238 [Prosthecobacter sp.]|nr:hypothetical protein [Prosthecobacter sp.]